MVMSWPNSRPTRVGGIIKFRITRGISDENVPIIRTVCTRKARSRMKSHIESNWITFYMPQMPQTAIYISTCSHKYKHLFTQNNNENDNRYCHSFILVVNSHQHSSKGAIILKGNFKRLLEFLQCLETPLELNDRSLETWFYFLSAL